MFKLLPLSKPLIHSRLLIPPDDSVSDDQVMLNDNDMLRTLNATETANNTISSNKIKVLYTNADQFLSKRDFLLAHIADNTLPDIIIISELPPKTPSAVIILSLISIPGYYIYLNFDPDNFDSFSTNIRGVGIFVRHKFQVSQVYFDVPHFEDHVWANIKLQGSDSLLTGCIYRSPSSNVDFSTASLCELLTGIHNYSHLLICGNFNYKEISWSDFSGATNNGHIEPFLEVVDDLFLFQHITAPTRFRPEETPSLLDLVFTSEQDMINNTLHLPPLGNSDHVCIEFDLICYLEVNKLDSIKYNIRAANIELMKQALSDVDWELILDPLDTNDAWLLFKTIFQDIVDKHVPTYRERRRVYTQMLRCLFSLKKQKNKLWKRYLFTRSPTGLATFKSVNNQLRSLTHNLKRNYERQLVQNIKSKPKAFWQCINSKVKTRPSITELLRSDGTTSSSDAEMANLFNDYFSSTFTDEDATSFPAVDTQLNLHQRWSVTK